jgi:hypothetical protein
MSIIGVIGCSTRVELLAWPRMRMAMLLSSGGTTVVANVARLRDRTLALFGYTQVD